MVFIYLGGGGRVALNQEFTMWHHREGYKKRTCPFGTQTFVGSVLALATYGGFLRSLVLVF